MPSTPSTPQPQAVRSRGATSGRNLLITAGPTHEPIDAVRFLGNRSSGRLGIELAKAAASGGWGVTLLLGPTPLGCPDARVRVERFQTTTDLQRLLAEHFPACDALVMAAAVADFRPIPGSAGVWEPGAASTKIKRGVGRLTLELESTPDLLAECAARRRPGQVLVGFALEPPERLLASAREKLRRKSLDAIVANPLKTMDSPDIEATILFRDGRDESTPGPIGKGRFALWLLDRLDALAGRPGGAASQDEPQRP